ncbi:hypothetical protein MP228_001849 [Amoeboaphelidium protococcarum]|nr:hypothetical protein MP228_001849 [Amoeboaphelidium protococcarum]
MVHLILAILFLSQSQITSVLSASVYSPLTQPICDGQVNTGPGGMFGYSISVSQASSNGYTYMAVGKPWDATVHIYSTPSLDLKNISVNATRDPTSYPANVTWTAVNMVQDTNNGTYPNQAYSLFGYSVSLSEDGQWLAVGVPGRSYSTQKTIQLQFNEYAGAVRIYKRILVDNAETYTYVGEIPNPNGMSRFWDKFGSKVMFKYEPVEGTFLFVAANAGWDGASTNFYSAQPYQDNVESGSFPAGAITDVSRAGVYVYRLLRPDFDPTKEQLGGSIVNPYNGIFNFLQQIRPRSSIPFGMSGLDFDVLVRDKSTLNIPVMTLLMRDFVIPSEDTPQNFGQLCPARNCSYLRVEREDGTFETVHGAGIVMQYEFDDSIGSFWRSDQVLSSFDQDFDQSNDWFGLGITSAFDHRYDRFLTAIGAPRRSSKLFTFYSASSSLQWNAGQEIFNPSRQPTQRTQSSFGRTMKFAPNGRFLVVANAAGAQQQLGRGNVYVYYRRAQNEVLFPYELSNITQSMIPQSQSQSPYFYDLLVGLRKGNPSRRLVQSVSDEDGGQNYTSFLADHFGFAFDLNSQFIVVGAPVEGCVYTYLMPQAVDIPKDNTTTVSPTSTPSDTPVITPQDVGTSSKEWLYALIAGIIALLFIVPVAMFLLKRRHKQQLLKELKAKNAVKDSNFTSQDALVNTDIKKSANAGDLDTRAGTLDNLAADTKNGEVVSSSVETLDN